MSKGVSRNKSAQEASLRHSPVMIARLHTRLAWHNIKTCSHEFITGKKAYRHNFSLVKLLSAWRGCSPLPLDLLIQLHQAFQVGICQIAATAVADVSDRACSCS